MRFIQKRSVASGLVLWLAIAAVLGTGFLMRADGTRAANAGVTALATLRFSPNAVSIGTGDSVTFTLGGGGHVVDLQDVFPDIPLDATHASGSAGPFAMSGTYYYYCSIHANASLATEAHVQANDAMVGKIVVTGAASPTATATTAVPTAAATTAVPTSTVPATPKPTTVVPPTTAAPTTTAVAPAPPKTGTGLASADGIGWPLALMLGLVSAVVLGASGLLLSRRR